MLDWFLLNAVLPTCAGRIALSRNSLQSQAFNCIVWTSFDSPLWVRNVSTRILEGVQLRQNTGMSPSRQFSHGCLFSSGLGASSIIKSARAEVGFVSAGMTGSITHGLPRAIGAS